MDLMSLVVGGLAGAAFALIVAGAIAIITWDSETLD